MNDIITVVQDPYRKLGKRFWLEGAQLHKEPVVSISLGLAVMHQIPDIQALENLLRQVGDDPHAAIINASFKGIEVGEKFVILSQKKLEEYLKLEGRENVLGVHHFTWNGAEYKAVARLKENVEPSSWQLLDRDTDEHTPEKFANMGFAEWLSCVDQILPVSVCDYLSIGSSSTRVVRV